MDTLRELLLTLALVTWLVAMYARETSRPAAVALTLGLALSVYFLMR